MVKDTEKRLDLVAEPAAVGASAQPTPVDRGRSAASSVPQPVRTSPLVEPQPVPPPRSVAVRRSVWVGLAAAAALAVAAGGARLRRRPARAGGRGRRARDAGMRVDQRRARGGTATRSSEQAADARRRAGRLRRQPRGGGRRGPGGRRPRERDPRRRPERRRRPARRPRRRVAVPSAPRSPRPASACVSLRSLVAGVAAPEKAAVDAQAAWQAAENARIAAEQAAAAQPLRRPLPQPPRAPRPRPATRSRPDRAPRAAARRRPRPRAAATRRPAGGLVCSGSGGSGAGESSVSAIGSAINAYRASLGLPQLSVSRSGSLVSHAITMANAGGIWHSGGDNIVACVSNGSASVDGLRLVPLPGPRRPDASHRRVEHGGRRRQPERLALRRGQVQLTPTVRADRAGAPLASADVVRRTSAERVRRPQIRRRGASARVADVGRTCGGSAQGVVRRSVARSRSSGVIVSGGARRMVLPWVSLASTPRASSRSHSCAAGRPAPGRRRARPTGPTRRDEPSRPSSTSASRRAPQCRPSVVARRLELAGLQQVDDREADRARQRVAAERRAVGAGGEHAEHVGAADDGGHGQHPAAERLAQGDQVGPDAPELGRERGAGAAEPGLDLVGDEEHVVLGAQRRGRPAGSRRAGRRRPARPGSARGARRRWSRRWRRRSACGVAVRDDAEPGRVRAEAAARVGVGGERHDRRRAAVEVAVGDDDRRAVGGHALDVVAPLAGGLDRGLDGLGARVHRQHHRAAGDERPDRGRPARAANGSSRSWSNARDVSVSRSICACAAAVERPGAGGRSSAPSSPDSRSR